MDLCVDSVASFIRLLLGPNLKHCFKVLFVGTAALYNLSTEILDVGFDGVVCVEVLADAAGACIDVV